MLQAVLAGGLCNGCEGWDEFPLDPDGVPAGSRHDAVQARRLGDFLQLDHVGWAHALWQANRLCRRPEFRRLAVAIARELEDRELLDQHDLITIHKEAACGTSL